MPPADWRALYPFESSWHTLPAGRMHYVDRGGGDRRTGDDGTLLFVHGNPTWSFHWRRLITSLEGRYRTVAVDHMGCGLSDKPQRGFRLADHIEHLVSLVDALELERVTLVAQDWGGAIGLGTLLARRERFERIVLFNTGAFPPWYIPWRIAACRWPVVGRLAVQGGNAFARAALRMTLSRRKRLDPAVEAGCLAPYDSWDHRRQIYEFVDDIPMNPRHPTWSTLEEIDRGLPSLAEVPSLLVWGMQDWCFRPDCLEKFVGYWPEAEVHRLADVGHWVVEDAPEEALHLMESFLARTSTADATAG
jgi:cis-3-alkyl-4-acyloxetan-2-one decarboxylase